MISPDRVATVPAWLRTCPGQVARLIEAHDWGATPLGPLDGWPGAMQSTLAQVLRSQLPIALLWGPEGVLIYNDAYGIVCGRRHPGVLGMPIAKAWPEAADFNRHVVETGLRGGTLAYRDQGFMLDRSGAPEQAWMNLDYSPIVDESGDTLGVMAIVVDTTAKVQAEERVRGERTRLKQMFDQAPGFMALLVGPDHVFDLANAAYLQLIGHRDVLGLPVRTALPEVNGQGFFERLDEAYASGRAFTGTRLAVDLQRAPAAPVEQRFVDLVYQPVRDQHGKVMGIFAQGADVTERVAAEDALRESEARFRSFAQVMPNHLWSATAEGVLDWFNDKVHEYSGLTVQELEGNRWIHMVHAEDLAEAQRAWAHSLATGEPYEVEFRLLRHDGSYRWHIARARPILSEAGKILRWLGSNTDIEEQKLSAQALSDLNRTLEKQVAQRTAERDRVWRLSTDIMLVADLSAAIVAVNPAWTATLGWSQQELVGRPFLEFVHPEDIAGTLSEIRKLSQGATTFKFENRYRHKEGHHVWLSWTAVPDEAFIHAVGRDISEDRAAAETLRRTEAALHRAQKMESVGQLTGGVAHDFKTCCRWWRATCSCCATTWPATKRPSARSRARSRA